MNGVYATNTPGCTGTTECQFKTLDEAKKFCNSEPTCTGILKHPAGDDCAGGSGCFTPRSGDEVADDNWKKAKGITYQKRCEGNFI